MLKSAPFREAIKGARSESGERNAIQRLLDDAGHRKLPTTERTTLDDGRSVRVYLWRDVGNSGCSLALIAGPEVVGDVRVLYPHAGGPKGSLFIPASGRHPALTDAKQARRNGGGGSAFDALKHEVAGTGSEQGQVNAVARALAAHGYAKAGHPEVSTTTVDRATFRIYLWRDTPFGDHLILSTGPSFEPALALASQIPAEPGIGFYVKALVDEHPRTLAGAGRAASRAMPKPTPAAEVAAEKTARKTRIPKAKIVEAAAAVAEAEAAPTVTVAHVEAVEEAAGIGWVPGARLPAAQARARDIARARGRERARGADEARVQDVADTARREATRILFGEGGSTGKAAQSRAAGVIAEARAQIRKLIARKSAARQHDLLRIETGLMSDFTRMITQADAEEQSKSANAAASILSAIAEIVDRRKADNRKDARVGDVFPQHTSPATLGAVIKALREQGFTVSSHTSAPMAAAGLTDMVVSWTPPEAEAKAAKAPRAAKAPKASAPAVDTAAAAREMQEMIAALRAMRGA